MRVLIIHPESQYFAGAETMLGYFLTELVRTDCKVAVAAVRGSRVAGLLPEETVPVWLEPCSSFSAVETWRQAKTLKEFHAEFPFDLVHSWAARGWELATLAGWRCQRPAIGTLHDHPEASFISRKRRRLMRWCARYGLNRISCVSEAVRTACATPGYPRSKLVVVRNGLPPVDLSAIPRGSGPFRMGFLGSFSERKGLRTLFQIADSLFAGSGSSWELHLAGGAADEAGERLLEHLRKAYATRPWWPRVQWPGWVKSPHNFLQTLDLLMVPSTEFDPFPTVLLEAGQSGVPALASRVGGVPEIVVDGQTGWLFEADKVESAVQILRRLMATPELLRRAGQAARERVLREFSAAKMVAKYRHLYSNLLNNV
ncbi:MAG TPA: glycosyltransferase family 4 protein [Patescibacteria group bacterium]|jgi:glycosyltransferase involved in cell wall biosynthesis|nr:glycosyltransferase family 4 protein [Patescibacteria group bacterium]